MSHAHTAGPVAFWPLTMMWFGMMAVMMAPTVWPWVRAFHCFAGDRASSVVAAAQFAAGYLFAWLGYSMAAALAQRALATIGAWDPASAGMPARIGAAVFVAAGLYQFAPLKRACLTHCRSPLSYFLTRWRDGPASGFRMGVHHGLYCVGCCWAVMATTLAVGVMNVGWMAVLAGFTLVEQIAPHGYALRRPVGIALLASGLWRLI